MQQEPFDHDAFGESSLGMDPKIAAALSYIPILGIIFFFLEKKSSFVRFHAAQGTLVCVAWLAGSIVVAIVGAIIGIIPILGWLIRFLLRAVVSLGGLALLIIGAVHAWNGRRIAFPIVGQFAEQFVRNIK